MLRLISAAVLSVALLSPAVAQTADQKAACKGDYQKLCSGVQPGGGRVLKCLQDNKDKVSDTCRKALNI